MVIIILIIINIIFVLLKYIIFNFCHYYYHNGFIYNIKYLRDCNYNNLSYKMKCVVDNYNKVQLKKYGDKKWAKIKNELFND